MIQSADTHIWLTPSSVVIKTRLVRVAESWVLSFRVNRSSVEPNVCDEHPNPADERRAVGHLGEERIGLCREATSVNRFSSNCKRRTFLTFLSLSDSGTMNTSNAIAPPNSTPTHGTTTSGGGSGAIVCARLKRGPGRNVGAPVESFRLCADVGLFPALPSTTELGSVEVVAALCPVFGLVVVVLAVSG